MGGAEQAAAMNLTKCSNGRNPVGLTVNSIGSVSSVASGAVTSKRIWFLHALPLPVGADPHWLWGHVSQSAA